MNMSVKEAVRIASAWVCVVVLKDANYYSVLYYDKATGTYVHGPYMPDRASALRSGWECKVRIALDLLGIPDTKVIASTVLRNYPKDWRHSVREGLRIAESKKLEA